MQIHNVKRNTKSKVKKVVGRGGRRGKTSGRGHKGQKAHSSGRIRPQLRDIIKKIPKRRGYRFKSIQEKPVAVNLRDIEAVFESGSDISPQQLIEKALVEKRSGRVPKVKILGYGEIKKKVTILNCLLSKSASEKIEKAGGSIK